MDGDGMGFGIGGHARPIDEFALRFFKHTHTHTLKHTDTHVHERKSV